MSNTVVSERIGRMPQIPPEPIEPAMTKYIDAAVAAGIVPEDAGTSVTI
jgi:hypothetical protein